jgi:hypothetical protein
MYENETIIKVMVINLTVALIVFLALLYFLPALHILSIPGCHWFDY